LALGGQGEMRAVACLHLAIEDFGYLRIHGDGTVLADRLLLQPCLGHRSSFLVRAIKPIVSNMSRQVGKRAPESTPFHRQRRVMVAAIFSAAMMIGALRLAEGTRGRMEPSTMRSFSRPCTRPAESVTARSSAPIRQVL